MSNESQMSFSNLYHNEHEDDYYNHFYMRMDHVGNPRLRTIVHFQIPKDPKMSLLVTEEIQTIIVSYDGSKRLDNNGTGGIYITPRGTVQVASSEWTIESARIYWMQLSKRGFTQWK
jgi:hypothetical protein